MIGAGILLLLNPSPLQLLLALFRILEATSGKIYIDGIDISTIGLHDCTSLQKVTPI